VAIFSQDDCAVVTVSALSVEQDHLVGILFDAA
jgi:hypothetical protein